MTLAQLIALFRARVEPEMGGVSVLAEPEQNIADPFVQAVIHPLGGLAELYERLDNYIAGYDISTSSCDDLDRAAILIGEARRTTGKRTRVEIIAVGNAGASIPANTSFTDRYNGTWTLDAPLRIASNGLGFGTASSIIGTFKPELNELKADLLLGVTLATNGAVLETGYTSESCEQFRQRLLSQEPIIETELGVLSALNALGGWAKFINDAPLCVSPYSQNAFVVLGGTDSEAVEAIRSHAPLNYTKLAGDQQIILGCETVRFMRPEPVGVLIRYYGKQISDDVFIDALCSGGLKAVNQDECVQHAEFALVPAYPESLNCVGLPDSGIDCNGSVSLYSDACYSTGVCPVINYQNCPTLNSWQYPVFVSAEYMGESC